MRKFLSWLKKTLSQKTPRPVRGKPPKVSAASPARASNGAREWYYALMDYGVMLAKTMPNPNKKSAHYSRQPRFIGSDRKLRGKILKILLQKNSATIQMLCFVTGEDSFRIRKLCDALSAEGFIRKRGRKLEIIP